MSKYLARPTDGAILIQNVNGTYSFMDSPMHVSYEYHKAYLLHLNFEEVTEDDFPRLKIKGEQYFRFLSWTHRNDGHGGCKGGTWEEFLLIDK